METQAFHEFLDVVVTPKEATMVVILKGTHARIRATRLRRGAGHGEL
jgi:hypothetical protein